MGLPVEVNPLFLENQYAIQRSLRFRSSASAYLSRTPASAGNRKTWTWSGWVKRGTINAGANLVLFGATGTTFDNVITFTGGGTNDVFRLVLDGTNAGVVPTAGVFRDPSAWYHLIVAVDTTQSTAANRVRIYVNGVETVYGTATYPSLNYDTMFNSTNAHNIGRSPTGSNQYFDGYMAEVNFIDGLALTPSSFGQYNEFGVWSPRKYGGSYGTNGFYLPYTDISSETNVLTGNNGLGKDFSGNANYWTTNNISLSGSTVTSFTSTGATTWTAPSGVTSIRYLVVAGGGGGGSLGGGGGAGGVLFGSLAVTPGTTYTMTVGAGGAGGAGGNLTTGGFSGSSGVNSSISGSDITTVTAIGGGGGGGWNDSTNGKNGGSGGGAGSGGGIGTGTGGTGTSGQGFAGGNAGNFQVSPYYSGGGGGAGAVGASANAANAGGTGIASTITGSSVFYGGGGGGTGWASGGGGAGAGGTGGGGSGSNGSTGGSGTANTGGGGGGTGYPGVSVAPAGGAGGSGIIIIAYGSGVTYDAMTDVPTPSTIQNVAAGNYCDLNPLQSYGTGTLTLTNGNLTSNKTATNSDSGWTSTFALGSGKWYAEFTFTGASVGGNNGGIGIIAVASTTVPGEASNTVRWMDAGTLRKNATSTSYGTALVSGDIAMVAYDADNNQIWFGKNGSWFASGNPATNTSPSATGLVNPMIPATYHYAANAVTIDANFGQRPFSSTPPSGFRPLNTNNLPSPTIPNGAKVMAAVTYAGAGGTQAVTTSSSNSGNNPLGTTFQPDFVWIKNRTLAWNNNLYDVVRGTGKALYSDLTDAEATNSIYGYLSAFSASGFSATAGSTSANLTNASGSNYVAWEWNAGTGLTTPVPSGGTITPTAASVNASAGFSVIAYTGTGSNATVPHGLGATPAFIIIKDRGSSTNGGVVYHTSLGATQYLQLFITTTGNNGYATDNTMFNGGSPTFNSSVFSVGTNVRTNTTDNYIAYCWAAVSGYSALGSYTGNGSVTGDGPFIYTGMRPRYLMVKRTDVAEGWEIIDTSRNTYNASNSLLEANVANAEITNTSRDTDFLSNGFKVRNNSNAMNASGGTYIYAAFAENPFKFALAR